MKKTILLSVILLTKWYASPAQDQKTSNSNWISTKTYLQPGAAACVEDIIYYNGLGYPVQQIGVAASPQGKSILQPIYYDRMLRDSARIYLPTVSETASAKMYADPFDLSHYRNTYGTTENGYLYTENGYDNAFTNRKSNVVQPGKVFRDNQREATIDYGVNRGDLVIRFEYINNSIKAPGYWPEGKLRKTTMRNEDGGETMTFLDGQGNLLLTRSIVGTQKLDTYYLYDDLGRLRHVFPPECSARITVGLYVSGHEYDYGYQYDKRNRIVEKTLPGNVKEMFVYDRCDRVAMSQDGNQRQNSNWTCNEYDPLGRVVKTLEVTLPGKKRSDLQAMYDAGQQAEIHSHASAKELARYDYDGNGDMHAIAGQVIDGVYYPTPDSLMNRVDLFLPVAGIVSDADCNPDRMGYKTGEKLYVVGPDNDTRIVSRRFYYDRKGRLIQTRERNQLGGISRMSMQYDFTGNVLKQHESHTTGPDKPADILLRAFSYDERGRLLTQTVTLNDGAPAIVRYAYDELGRIAGTTFGTGSNAVSTQYVYNLQGWLTQQSSPLFSTELRYYNPELASSKPSFTGNISEWKWKNRDAFTADIYTFEYDELSRLINTEHSFERHFIVDSMLVSRDSLHIAVANSSSVWIDPLKLPETEKSISYDRNGNIISMSRCKGSAYREYNAYLYDNNRLRKIMSIPIRPPRSTSDGFESILPDSGYVDVPFDSTRYHYDAVGNMTFDPDRKLSLAYNRLNLLEKVSSDGVTYAKYAYLWDGTKVSALDGNGEGLCYLGSLVYRQESNVEISGEFDPNLRDLTIFNPYSYSLESAGFEGGRIAVVNTAQGKTCSPRYHLTDHLGSVRVVVNADGTVVERNDYLPYGKRWTGGELSDNRYRYNGKEEQAFINNPYLDYGARMYDPDKRLSWNSADPLAEKYYPISPYAFCAGNPINFIDPNGMDIWEIDQYGYIINRKVDKTRDAFYLVDEEGKRIDGKFVEFDKGTVLQSENLTVNDQIATYDIQIFKIKGSENSQRFFEKMSENNVGVEWSNSKVEKNGSISNIVSTSHNVGTDASAGYLMNDGYTVLEHTHNHPFSSIPSQDDRNFHTKINSGRQANTYIYYTYGKGDPFYIQYNSKGSVLNMFNYKKRLTP